MALRFDRGQLKVAEPDLLSVAENPADLRRRERRMHSGLRIACSRRAGSEHGSGIGRSEHLRSGQLLQAADAADMVDMLVAVQQNPHVRRTEAELANVADDEVRAGFGPGIDEDMALASGDQDRGDPARADEIGVGVDPDRRRRLVPIVIVVADGIERRTGGLDRSPRLFDLLRSRSKRNADKRRLRRHRCAQREEASEHSSLRSRRWSSQ